MYYTVIKHDGHLKTRVFSNVRNVLLQCNTRLRLLHLLYEIDFFARKTTKHAFSMFYLAIRLRARVFYKQIVNEAQPS